MPGDSEVSPNAPPSTAAPAGEGQMGGKRSAWMTHVKKTMRAHKGKSLSQVLKMAAKSYKKTAKGGRKSRKSRGRKH